MPETVIYFRNNSLLFDFEIIVFHINSAILQLDLDELRSNLSEELVTFLTAVRFSSDSSAGHFLAVLVHTPAISC